MHITKPKQPISILDPEIPIGSYCPIDLSVSNEELTNVQVSNPIDCQQYIDKVLHRNKARVAYGGYLEHRRLYDESNLFSKKEKRNIHLGVDFWAPVGTKVITPLDGVVHSFKNNASMGDYGPTIILEHRMKGDIFYTLYGHLSLESIMYLELGVGFKKGEVLATLGETTINVNYAPHLHFQMIDDMEGNIGDYPGVCSLNDLGYYKKNCPNPKLLLGF